MVARIKRTYRLNEETINRIDKVADAQNLSKEKAIEYVFEQYFQKENEISEVQKVEERLKEEIKKMQNDLSRIRGASNNIDRNTQMQIEFWNHYFIVNPTAEFIHTDKYQRKELTEADMLIKQRIANLRQKKLDHDKRIK